MLTILIKTLCTLLIRIERTEKNNKKNLSYNAFTEILFGVPQDSIFGPLLFKIYNCDFLFETSDIDTANYADDRIYTVCLFIRP